MSCLPFTDWIQKKKNCPEIETHQHNRSTNNTCISKKKVKDYIESLQTENLMESICHWLENDENEKENYSYMDKSDDALSLNESDDDLHERLKTKVVKLKDIRPKKLLENYMHEFFIHKLDPLKCTNVNHSITWRPSKAFVK